MAVETSVIYQKAYISVFLFFKKKFRHNAEDFSKLAFGAGKHRDFDMSAPRCHFASFMALTPTIRGRMDTYLALENWNNKI